MKVIMFKMDNCPLCERALKLLNENNIQYLLYNIRPYANRGYPYFFIDGKLFEYEDFIELMMDYMTKELFRCRKK